MIYRLRIDFPKQTFSFNYYCTADLESAGYYFFERENNIINHFRVRFRGDQDLFGP
jgi:hypothetical protein